MGEKNNHVVYYIGTDRQKFLVGVHVDDLIIIVSKVDGIKEVKGAMKGHFIMVDLGLLSSYLGIEVKQCKMWILLSQRVYSKNVLERFKTSECKSAKTPIEIRRR